MGNDLVNIFDETDARVMGYLTDGFELPPEPEFSDRLTLKNHSLTKRRYKASFNIGYKDYGSNVRDFDIVRAGLVSFEVPTEICLRPYLVRLWYNSLCNEER